MISPKGAHIHFSSDRCKLFSCRDQSYFDLKRSVQNVHWKGRKTSSESALCPFVGSRRRLRLSFDLRLFIDPRECLDPWEYAEV